MHNPAITQHLTTSQAHDIQDTHRGFSAVPGAVRKVNFSPFHLLMLSRTSQQELLRHIPHHLPDWIHVVVTNTPLTQFRLSVMWYVVILVSRPTSQINLSFMKL